MTLPILSDKKIIKALQKAGFEFAPKRGKGSHVAFFKTEIFHIGRNKKYRTLLVIVPKRKDIPRGTLRSILEQANMSIEDLMKYLK